MQSQTVIIQKPNVDFDAFLSIASQVLGYNPAAKVDKSPKKMTESERLVACLQSLKNPEANKLRDYFLEFSYLTVMVLALEDDMLEVTEICTSMPCMSTETLRKGVSLGIITGTLRQWRNCVAVGCSKDSILTVNTLFAGVYQQFVKDGYQFVWNNYSARPHTNNQILLEYNG